MLVTTVESIDLGVNADCNLSLYIHTLSKSGAFVSDFQCQTTTKKASLSHRHDLQPVAVIV